ncbi:MAG TPA: SET domain-containing protein-lysine N-methyltransferase [Terracidiphilus sp.]|jgi:SET domain-containing protein
MSRDVIVKTSEINGLGVFAARAFAAGDVVLTIDDSFEVSADHPVPDGEEHHCDYLERGRVVWMGIPERYINHSCDPNVYVLTLSGVRRVLARRNIEAGDEIAYDYCVNGYGDVVWTCHCGAARCRQTIHSDFFHLPFHLQREYAPLLDHWFCTERARELQDLRLV